MRLCIQTAAASAFVNMEQLGILGHVISHERMQKSVISMTFTIMSYEESKHDLIFHDPAILPHNLKAVWWL